MVATATGHDSEFSSNLVLVVPYDGSNCVNVGGFQPHHGHKHFNNTCINGVSPLAAPSGCGVPACADPHRAPPDMRTVANIDDCAGRRAAAPLRSQTTASSPVHVLRVAPPWPPLAHVTAHLTHPGLLYRTAHALRKHST